MLALDAAPRTQPKGRLLGKSSPRLAPPLPAVGRLKDYMLAAEKLGLTPYPWQKIAARYLTATTPKRLWFYRDFTAVVSRRNGKTEFVMPRIVMALEDGDRCLHTAQDRALPRLTFEHLADLINDESELRAQVRSIRTANGTESIQFKNGGRYILLAPGHGVRGHQGDVVFEDEVREQRDYRLQRAIGPTSLASRNPQRIKTSNAGDDGSIVLNDLRDRMDEGGAFCYLEWSAAPERAIDDRAGWAEANPALGHGYLTLPMLEDARRTQTPSGFETEHLCRWVVSMEPSLVAPEKWQAARGVLSAPIFPMMAISMAPDGARASASIAWQAPDGSISLRVVADVTGDPIDTEDVGTKLRKLAAGLGVFRVGFDKWTDAELARYFIDPKAIEGKEYANASENFVRVIESGRLHWDIADSITDDLMFTARKTHESGAWMAVRAREDRPITAVQSAIRAVWLASGPRPTPARIF